MRRAARRDETEDPIVKGLRKMGFQVYPMQRPCDLLVRLPRTRKIDILEVDGITKNRKRDQTQLDFLRDWDVPVVKTLEQALRALGHPL